MPTVYRIHPSIGVARVGNQEGTTPQDFFIGPESPGHQPVPPGGYKRGGRIKRQGARFRVYEYQTDAATGELRPTREITSDDARITWTVRLTNSKSAGAWFHRDAPGDPLVRNASVTAPDERRRLLVLDREESIASGDAGPRPLEDFFLDRDNAGGDTHRVHLGDLLTDERGRLIVLGGFGKSFSPTGRALTAPPSDTFNRDEWCDDVSDGIVTASITLDGAPGPVRAEFPARVIVGPPDYAPPIDNIISLYDVAEDVATRLPAAAGPLPGPAQQGVSFARHIYPILKRVARIHWVTNSADGGHAPGSGGDFLRPSFLALLRDPDPSQALEAFEARNGVFSRLRPPPGSGVPSGVLRDMPDLREEIDTGRELSLTLLQFERMRRWALGNFDPDNGVDLDAEPVPFEQIGDPVEQTRALDKAGLDTCVGGSFYPGIEASRVMRDPNIWEGPFRVARGVPSGALTEGMALPWQTDFLACGQRWWPPARPNQVRLRNPQNPATFLRVDWHRGSGGSTDFTNDTWSRMGIVVRDGNDFLESERDESPDFAPPPPVGPQDISVNFPEPPLRLTRFADVSPDGES